MTTTVRVDPDHGAATVPYRLIRGADAETMVRMSEVFGATVSGRKVLIGLARADDGSLHVAAFDAEFDTGIVKASLDDLVRAMVRTLPAKVSP